MGKVVARSFHESCSLALASLSIPSWSQFEHSIVQSNREQARFGIYVQQQ